MASPDKPQEKPGTYRQYRRVQFDHAVHFDRWGNSGSSETSYVQIFESQKTQAYVKSIMRTGDTVYVTSLGGEVVEVPYSRVTCAVQLTKEDFEEMAENGGRILNAAERAKKLAGPQPDVPFDPPPKYSIAFTQGAVA